MIHEYSLIAMRFAVSLCKIFVRKADRRIDGRCTDQNKHALRQMYRSEQACFGGRCTDLNKFAGTGSRMSEEVSVKGWWRVGGRRREKTRQGGR